MCFNNIINVMLRTRNCERHRDESDSKQAGEELTENRSFFRKKKKKIIIELFAIF